MWHAPGEARSVHLWSLSEDVRVERSAEDDTLLLTGPWGPERLDRPAPSVREALRRMELGPVVLGNAVQEFEDLRRFILPAAQEAVASGGAHPRHGRPEGAAPVGRPVLMRPRRSS